MNKENTKTVTKNRPDEIISELFRLGCSLVVNQDDAKVLPHQNYYRLGKFPSDNIDGVITLLEELNKLHKENVHSVLWLNLIHSSQVDFPKDSYLEFQQ